MHSGLIGKIEKARRYAEERRERIEFDGFAVRVHGENSEHTVQLEHGAWHCSCEYFQGQRICSHTMTMERVLDGMLTPAAQAEIMDRLGQTA